MIKSHCFIIDNIYAFSPLFSQKNKNYYKFPIALIPNIAGNIDCLFIHEFQVHQICLDIIIIRINHGY